jgi:hypothetical protein
MVNKCRLITVGGNPDKRGPAGHSAISRQVLAQVRQALAQACIIRSLPAVASQALAQASQTVAHRAQLLALNSESLAIKLALRWHMLAQLSIRRMCCASAVVTSLVRQCCTVWVQVSSQSWQFCRQVSWPAGAGGCRVGAAPAALAVVAAVKVAAPSSMPMSRRVMFSIFKFSVVYNGVSILWRNPALLHSGANGHAWARSEV